MHNVFETESRSVASYSLQPMDYIQFSNSPGQDTEVGRPSLLQEIFPTQGSNPGLLHCGQILNKPSHKGRPRILEWVAYPCSRYRTEFPALQANSLPYELQKCKSKPQCGINSCQSEWLQSKSLQTTIAGEGGEKVQKRCSGPTTVDGNTN